MVLGRDQLTEQSTEDKVQDCKCYSRALPLGRTKKASGKGKTRHPVVLKYINNGGSNLKQILVLGINNHGFITF